MREIKAKIQELVPEVMELKCGCEAWGYAQVADPYVETRRIKFVIVSDRMYDENLVLARIQGNWETVHLEKRLFDEILGCTSAKANFWYMRYRTTEGLLLCDDTALQDDCRTEADARAKMLIYLLENNLITI